MGLGPLRPKGSKSRPAEGEGSATPADNRSGGSV